MKRSKRLIGYTIAALSAVAVLYVGINRWYANGSPATRRTPATELAALHGFSEIDVNGDFGVDVVQAANHAVAFTASATSRGNFAAAVHGEMLVLRGFGNASTDRVRVALPEVKHLKASGVDSLVIAGFDGNELSLRIIDTRQVVLRKNNIRRWRVTASDVGELRIDRASITSGQWELMGDLALRVVD